MSYFSSAALNEIRDDPTTIVSIYNSVRTQFISDLNMPGLDEAAIQAAFCTVVAFDLVDYGTETAANTLSALLAEPTLACDSYAMLAGELLSQFGASTNELTYVGWNGGAVGNHSQILFSDGASNLLLDPTIGLVVANVTYHGLVGGTHYAEMTSFYDRTDLNSFNAEVIAAVSNGSYKPSDLIYYVPTLTAFTDYAYETTGLSSIATSYVGQNQILAATYRHTDGSWTIFSYDALNEFSWNSIATDYDNAGGRVSATYEEHDGTEVRYLYDPLGQYSWSAVHYDYNNLGSTTAVTYNEDSGTRVLYLYDVLDQFSWNTVQYDYSSQDAVTSVTYAEHDGTQAIYIYDTLDQFAWSNVQFDYNSDDAVTSVTYTEHDGTQAIYIYDMLDQFSWSNVEYEHNDHGATTSVTYDERDGTQVIYVYDLSDQYAWSSVEVDYNDQGVEASYTHYMDNGDRDTFLLGASGQFPWSSVEYYFDSQSNETLTTYHNDSGNTVSGAGTIGGGNGMVALNNAGALDATGGTLTLDSGNTIINSGLLETSSTGTLVIDDAVSNSGSGHAVVAGGTLEFAASSNVDVTFDNGVTGTAYGLLMLADAADFSGQISGFAGTAPSQSDQVELVGFTETSFQEQTSGNNLVLTLNGGSVQLTFDNFGGTLNISTDGSGNTFITDPPKSTSAAASSANPSTVAWSEPMSHQGFVFRSDMGADGASAVETQNGPIETSHVVPEWAQAADDAQGHAAITLGYSDNMGQTGLDAGPLHSLLTNGFHLH
ncbi:MULTISPECIES: hypothetical protein [Bradyrhizobium]|uniref:RHS repeat protein n=1 Tax=Bradyrhizobium brasilense TaxID=1419277 RepID=A0ABY8JMR2_9BRAD|nr:MULTISPECIES: hypothetical protein [Bradyrhizobium]WFU66865.1 hypothetical protein QA636_15820 [Bradyrhizobium brasilense]